MNGGERMEPGEKSNSQPVNLEDFRRGKRRERFVRKSMEKTALVRDLLNEGLLRFNVGSEAERRVVAFALNDLLRKLDDEDLNCFKELLRKVEAGLL